MYMYRPLKMVSSSACICTLTNLNTISVIIVRCVDPSGRYSYIIG